MRERLITLLGGGVSLLLVIVLLTPPTRHEEVSLPTSTDRGEHGLRGLWLWLQANAVPTASLRRRYDVLLTDPAFNPSGNLLLTSLPQRVAVHYNEARQLARWLEQGNHLLVLAAKNDWPPWAMQAAATDPDRLLHILGFAFTAKAAQPPDEPGARADWTAALERPERQPVVLQPTLSVGVLTGVQTIASYAYAPLQALGWRLEADARPGSRLVLLSDRHTEQAALWQLRFGKGGAWVASYSDLAGNPTLGMADNARLLANMINHAVAPKGQVIFDDFHFGLTDLYDPQAFYRDPRLHNTLLFIGAFWLLYLLGRSPRLAPVKTPATAPRTRDYVEAMAGFLARRLDAAAVARGLLTHFYNDMRAVHQLPQTGEPIWPLLAAKAPRRDRQALQRYVHDLERGRKPDLMALTRLLDRLRRSLQ